MPDHLDNVDAAEVARLVARKLRALDPQPPARLALTPDEAAKSIGMPPQTLRDKINSQEIAATVYGKGIHKKRKLVQLADLKAWLDRNRVPAKWETKNDDD